MSLIIAKKIQNGKYYNYLKSLIGIKLDGEDNAKYQGKNIKISRNRKLKYVTISKILLI